MIASILIPYELDKTFDYDVSAFPQIAVGMRVSVDFAGKRMVGVVAAIKETADVAKVKAISAIIDDTPSIPQEILKLSRAVADRYCYAQGAMLDLMMPKALAEISRHAACMPKRDLQTIDRAKPDHVLVREDVCAVARYELYATRCAQAAAQGMGSIIVVPNAKDVAPLAAYLAQHCPHAGVIQWTQIDNSKEELALWRLARAHEALICVGTRNALFAPYERVGFIAVENEHGYGHIHGAKPYAHCRDVALLRAKVGGASVAIHADVPTVESRYYADRGHLRELDLRAVHAPETVVYDLRKYEFRKYPLFSDLAFHHIHAFLAKGKKVIVYWNRKGFAGALSCQRCHEMIPCESCRAYLRVDKTRNRLVCGACGKSKPMPEVCPSCGHKSMKALGVGVDRMMESLAKQFPDKVTATYSSEDDALPAQWDLLIATQVFFESSHCASADLVIAAGLDAQASMGDFDAGLQMFVQLTRLRARAKERFVLFTQDPSFEPVAALEKGEAHFYTHECRTRAEMGLPPFWNVFEITLRSVQEAHVCERAEATVRQLADACVGIAEVYGPLPGEPAFFRGQHHRRIVVKTKDTAAVRVALKSILPQARKGSVKLAVTVR